MCGIAIWGVLCLGVSGLAGGIISLAQGHQTSTHTHTHTLRVLLEVNVRERAPPQRAENRPPPTLIFISLPLYIIEKATQQGTLGGCPSSGWGEG